MNWVEYGDSQGVGIYEKRVSDIVHYEGFYLILKVGWEQ